MNIITKIETWGNEHRLAFMDYVRVLLGIFITYKGVDFMINIESLHEMTGSMDVLFISTGLAHYVIFVHVLGGPLIAFGLYTRVVSLLQLPILIGAVFLVNAPRGFLSVGNLMELEVSVVVLLLLTFFMIFGAGKFSIDALRRKEAAQRSKG